jgi:hypothetical protein
MTQEEFQAPAGASVWERDMLTHLSKHSIREGAQLAEYGKAAERSPSKALHYAIRMVLADEERHHRWFSDLASSLQAEVAVAKTAPVIPWLDLDLVDRSAVGHVLERMIDSERHDAHELKRLSAQWHDAEGTTLWGLLIEVMQRDTDKHIEMLRWLHKHMSPRVAAGR